MRRLMAAMVVTLVGASGAWAGGPQWQYRVVNTVPPGTPAALLLQSKNDVHEVLVELSSAGGTKTFHVKKLKAGEVKRLEWKVPVGTSEWKGTLTGSADGATTVAPVELKVVSLGPLDVTLDKQDVDLVAGTIVVIPNRPLDRAEITAFGAGGGKVIDTSAAVEVDGARSVVRFDVPDDVRLARVELKLLDGHGYWVGLRVVSWYAEIAHKDVEFESGKWDVRATEAPKVDQAIEALHTEVARFRKELGNDAASVEARVYVAGYTDTVGSAADNQALSRKRARAIAEYFRGHGVGLPIYYQGFGEAVLAVPTPDNTDQPHNRRAMYVLTNVPPGGAQFPGRTWTKL